MKDHYATLGVSPDATGDEVRSAFRAVARIHHPDVSDSAESKDVFFAAKEAYEVLIDSNQRRTYDLTRAYESQIEENKKRSSAKAQERVRQMKEDTTTSGDVLRMSMLLNSHRIKEAEAVARQVLRIDPKSGPAYATLAEAARVRGDLETSARYFAFAAQFAPDNKVFIEKCVAAQEALLRRQQGDASRLSRTAPFALGTGTFVLVTSAVYVVLAAEPAVLPAIKPISAWPLSLIFMMLIAGLGVGVSLSIAGVLDVYDVNRGSAVMRVPPATALGAVAVLNFWVALGFYVLVGVTQNAFNASMSRLMGGVLLALIVFCVAAYNLNSEAAFQTLLWGGNLIYLSAAMGWFVADSLKR